MKKIFFLLVLFVTGNILNAQNFTVTDYHVDITINKDGYFDVTENYKVTFNVEQHGLWRKIPYRYNLTDENGKPENRSISIKDISVDNWKYRTETANGNVGIKIGDKNTYVSGAQEYVIKYRVKNAFLYNKNNCQFYWNLLGPEWEAAFEKVSCTIHLPENLPLTKQQYFVYTGTAGSRDSAATLQYENGVLTGTSTEMLGNGRDMTVLIDLPKGYIYQPSAMEMLWAEYYWLLFPLLLIIGFYMVWRKYGRDNKLPMVVEYFPPKDMDPARAGFIADDRADNNDLTALIPHWGAQGYLEMQITPKKGLFGKEHITIIKKKDLPATTTGYEKIMFDGLFSYGDTVEMEDLKDSFYTTMNAAQSALKTAVKQAGYYDSQSRKMVSRTAIALVILGVSGAFLLISISGPLAMGVWIAVCLVLLVLTPYIIKPTPEGDALKQQTLGFKQFVEKAERNKLETLLQEDPTYFEKTLGYAVAFGMARQWAHKFDGLSMQPPTWYYGSSMMYGNTMNTFSAAGFADSFTKSMNQVRSNMVSSPSSSSSGSSSGGGSSGGGFGGGGGGSW